MAIWKMMVIGFYCGWCFFIWKNRVTHTLGHGSCCLDTGKELAEGDGGEGWTQRVGTLGVMSEGPEVC